MSKELFTHLIIKSFQGRLSDEEQSALERWLKEDAGHQALFDQLKTSWQLAEGYKEDFEVDLEKGWQSIKSGIGDVNETPRVIPLWQRTSMRIAASVALLIGITWAAFHHFGSGVSHDLYTAHTTRENEIKEISLPDGSSVTLNENSRLSYPTDFGQRNVDLEGEALFNVEHDPAHPFTVAAAGTKTTVLGTAFNVNADLDDVYVSLIEGSVAFTSPEEEEIILVPGETANYNAAKGILVKQAHSTLNFNAWKTGVLAFDRTSLDQVVEDLENYFDKTIDLVIEGDETCVFTGTFKAPTYNEIIDVLSFTFELNHTERDGAATIVISSCQ
jgi:ferric-dicitrate binding protein FerR (iron transport regulator)